jgi:arginyl-tRNA synthetase
LADLRRQLSGWLADALASAYPEARDLATTLERPRDAAHGDFASNAAMVAARALKRNPREIATRIVAALAPSELVAKAEVAGAGFF